MADEAVTRAPARNYGAPRKQDAAAGSGRLGRPMGRAGVATPRHRTGVVGRPLIIAVS